jgi:hypothetical protein
LEKKSTLTRTLAIAGTVLAWLPVLAPFLFSALVFIRAGRFHFDYLMPAEMFLFFIVGGALLVWAALRARSRRRLIAWALGIAVVSVVGGQVLAVATGLASGETEATGWPWALVLGSIAVYSLAVVAVGVGGVLLLGDLFRRRAVPTQGL